MRGICDIIRRAMEKQNKNRFKTSGMKRMQFDISEDDSKKLVKLVEDSGAASMAEVIRNALSLYQFLVEESKKGCRIQVFDPESNVVKEPIFRGLH
jgi:Arc/MetJ-type ribon-helix-helix transcriptional regulator